MQVKRRSLEQKGDGVSFADARPDQKKKPKPSKRSSVDRGHLTVSDMPKCTK